MHDVPVCVCCFFKLIFSQLFFIILTFALVINIWIFARVWNKATYTYSYHTSVFVFFLNFAVFFHFLQVGSAQHSEIPDPVLPLLVHTVVHVSDINQISRIYFYRFDISQKSSQRKKEFWFVIKPIHITGLFPYLGCVQSRKKLA